MSARNHMRNHDKAQLAPSTITKYSAKLDLDAVVQGELQQAQERGRPLKAIAYDSQIPGWRLYEIHEGKKRLTFAESARLMEAVGSDVLLEALAHARGAMVFKVATVSGTFADLYAALTRTMQELGDVARVQAERLADGDLSPEDALAIVGELDQLISAAAAMKDLAMRKTSLAEAKR